MIEHGLTAILILLSDAVSVWLAAGHVVEGVFVILLYAKPE